MLPIQFINILSQPGDFIIPFKYGIGCNLKLPSPLGQLHLEIIYLGLKLLLHLLGVAAHVFTFFAELLFQGFYLGSELGLHRIELVIFQLFQFFETTFIIFNERILLLFEEAVHFLSLVFVRLLHLSFFTFELFAHILNLLLELIDKVSTLALQHFDLRFQIFDFGFILNPGFFGLSNFFLFFIFQAIHICFEISYLFLKFFNLITELLDLFLHVAVGRFQNVVETLDFSVKPCVFRLILFIVVFNSLFESLNLIQRFL